jgi:signal transduction histidine kinase/NO-binding membrane sensor protein with MHYT domain
MLHQSYDALLVIASMIVASLAGFAALDLSTHVAGSRGWQRARWVAASAVAMGVGIWSMHFVAMLALRIAVPVVYDVPLLALSLVIAISASAITFLGAAGTASTRRLATASLAMGPAVAGMHYTGMAAMRMPARIHYREELVALSVLIAISASFAALVLIRHFGSARPEPARKVLASILMGAAVYGMHYTGMVAASFVPAPDIGSNHEGVIATHGLGWAIAAGATIVIGFAVLASVVDRRLNAAHQVALEASRQQALMVGKLQEIGRSLASELELRRIVQAVTDAGTELTGAQFGAFFYNLVNASGEAYTLYTLSGVPREAFARFPMPRNTHVFRPTFYGEATVRSDNITKDERYGHNPPHNGMPTGHLPVRSYLAVPVISRSGNVLGGLFFGHENVGVFTAQHEQLVEGIAGWAALAMDNANLFKAEQHARAEAERASHAKSDFLAVMSHELRTPLNAIIGYTDLLRMGLAVDGADRDRKLDRIRLSASHLLQLIDEVLTFARLEAGEERIELETMDAARPLAEVEALMEPLAARRGIRFEFARPARTPDIVTDGRKVRQILINLVNNAIKFTNEGSVSGVLEIEGDHAAYVISDTGCGIANEHLDRIFETFWRVENGATRNTSGTGLGLSVSRKLARLMGGDVTVESRLGQGSTFTLRLPLHAARPLPAVPVQPVESAVTA